MPSRREKTDQSISLKESFEKAQLNTYQHDGLVKLAIHNCEQSENTQRFTEELISLMKHSMIVYKNEPAIERLIKFISKLVANLGLSSDKKNTTAAFNAIFTFLIKAHEANDKAVRYRSCQLIAEIIIQMGEAEMDEELCDQIFQAMLTRLSDKVHAVRLVAVKALARLQDPTDKKCPVIKAFRFLMSRDPTWLVRVECLRCIAPTRRTLLDMIERTRDINEVIRMTAYKVLAEKISVKALTIKQRLDLLESGLSDRSAAVRKACSQKLLQAWLIHYQANILELLSGLDITGSRDICGKVVNIVLETCDTREVVEGFDLLNEMKLIIPERLSCESIFYYKLVCKYLNKGGEDQELLDKLLPDANIYVKYVLSYCEGVNKTRRELVAQQKSRDVPTTDVEQFERIETEEFILQQLVEIVQLLDISDPVSRTSVLTVCSKLLQDENVPESLIPQLVSSLNKVLLTPTARIEQVSLVISEIMMPSYMEDIPIDENQQRQIKLKLAEITLKINELKELLDEQVSNQNFVAAAELKQSIGDYEQQKARLMKDMMPQQRAVQSQPRTDDTTKLRCLTILSELLKSLDIKIMSGTLRSYLDELVIPSIPERSPAVRNQAVRSCGQLTLCDIEVARKALPIFAQIVQVDEEQIRVSALEAIFDIILTYGLECFQTSPLPNVRTGASVRPTPAKNGSQLDSSSEDHDEAADEDAEESPESQESNESDDIALLASKVANDLIHNLVGLLEDESSSIRSLVAEGLAKLLLNGRVSSNKLLTRLLIAWYNPVTEDDAQLRHCLGVFFPMFSFSHASNQMLMCEAFMPTLKIILDAPNNSPLSDIDEKNVAELLIQLTNHKRLLKLETATEDCLVPHDELAIQICNELLQSPRDSAVTLCSCLTQLELSTDNKIFVKDLLTLVNKLLDKVKERQAQKYLDKIHKILEAHMETEGDTVTPDDETTKVDPTNEEPMEQEQEGDSDGAVDFTVLDSSLAASKRKHQSTSSRSRTTLNSTSRLSSCKTPSGADITKQVISEEPDSQSAESSDDSMKNMRSKIKVKKLNLDEESD